MSLGLFVAICVCAWLAGALFGFSLRGVFPAGTQTLLSKPRGRRRRRTGYYFSDDDQSWGDTRWRRRLTLISVFVIASLLTLSGAFALMNYKGRANAAAGYRAPAAP